MKAFIGLVANIALYNLSDIEFERHDLEGGRTGYLVDASDEKIAIWKEANSGNLEECEISLVTDNSTQMAFMKKRILDGVRTKSGESILEKYPLYKQNNINNLQGYGEVEKVEMWDFINETRDGVTVIENQILASVSLAELKKIEEGL